MKKSLFFQNNHSIKSTDNQDDSSDNEGITNLNSNSNSKTEHNHLIGKSLLQKFLRLSQRKSHSNNNESEGSSSLNTESPNIDYLTNSNKSSTNMSKDDLSYFENKNDSRFDAFKSFEKRNERSNSFDSSLVKRNSNNNIKINSTQSVIPNLTQSKLNEIDNDSFNEVRSGSSEENLDMVYKLNNYLYKNKNNYNNNISDYHNSDNESDDFVEIRRPITGTRCNLKAFVRNGSPRSSSSSSSSTSSKSSSSSSSSTSKSFDSKDPYKNALNDINNFYVESESNHEYKENSNHLSWLNSKRKNISNVLEKLSNHEEENDEIKSNQFFFKDFKNSSYILKNLNELRLTKTMCDIILVADNEEMHCHKCVLVSISSYFKAMFSLELAESKQSKILLNEIDPSTLKSIIEYAYTSNLNINESNVQALLSAANLFDIKSIKEACSRYMEWQMDESNCIGVYCFSDAHDCKELKDIAFKYILFNFKKVINHDEFLSLTQAKLIDIIKNDSINVQNEEIVFNACLKWLKHSPDTRNESFHNILEHIRLPLLSSYFLYDNIQSNPFLNKCEKCNYLIKEAFDYNLLKDRRNQIQNERTKSRKFFKHIEALIVICGENDNYVLRTVEAYIPSLERWLSLKSFSFSLTKCGVVAPDENILYICGGERSDGSVSNLLWQYNSVLDEWKQLQSMQTPRTKLGLAIVDGRIYAIGGKDKNGSDLTSVESYDPMLNIWKYCTFMNSAISNPAICSLNGLLYVIAEKFNQIYNPLSNNWEEFPRPEHIRSGARACAFNGKIYLIGGMIINSNEITNLVECYDPLEKKWSKCPSLLEARAQPGVAILNNGIYVSGGETTNGETSFTIETYDFEKKEWYFITTMKKERNWLACTTLRLENPLTIPFIEAINEK